MHRIPKLKQGYGYKYADLSQIHELLEQTGYQYYQYIERVDNDDYIMTVIIDQDGNESIPLRGCRVVQATLTGKSNPAQEQGSALTYARRYSLLMAFGLATEDDDAQCLTRTTAKPKSKPRSNQTASKAQNKHAIINDQQFAHAQDLIDAMGKTIESVCNYFKIPSLNDMTEDQYNSLIDIYEKWKAKNS